MTKPYVLAAVLLVIAIVAVLGVMGKLDGPRQRCLDAGKVWIGVKGAKCVKRTPDLERRLTEGPTWTGD